MEEIGRGDGEKGIGGDRKNVMGRAVFEYLSRGIRDPVTFHNGPAL